MCDAVPKVREHIKEASMSDLKDFLESIRKHSEKIGEIAMKHVRLVTFVLANCVGFRKAIKLSV